MDSHCKSVTIFSLFVKFSSIVKTDIIQILKLSKRNYVSSKSRYNSQLLEV